MTTSTTSPDDILAMLSSEFGKKQSKAKPQPKKIANTPTDTAKTLMQQETSEANRIARLLSATSLWKPVAVVAHIVEQECRCCLGKTEIIGNILVKHIHKTTRIEWDCAMPESPQYSSLPHEILTHTQSVAQCPACLRVELRMSSTDRAVSRQFEMFQ